MFDLVENANAATRHLLDSRTISGDVTFTFSGGEGFFCDRFMLAARSPVFRAMFYGHMSEAVSSHPEVAIDDLPAQDVRALLTFIYTDKMPEGPNLLEMQGLLAAARKYCLSTLQNICSDAIVRSLTPDNACQHCAEAYARSEFELATSCLKVIASSFQHVPVTEIAKLPAECLKLLLQSNETAADEVRIFSACLAWLQYRMQRGEDADSSLREVISLVRFENISSQEFAMHVVPTGLLPAEQMLEILAAGVLVKLHHRPRGDSDHEGGDTLIVLGGLIPAARDWLTCVRWTCAPASGGSCPSCASLSAAWAPVCVAECSTVSEDTELKPRCFCQVSRPGQPHMLVPRTAHASSP